MRKILLTCLILGIVTQGYCSAAVNQTKPSFIKTIKSNDITALEEKTLVEINKVRRQYGLRPLKKWEPLTTCARAHSEDMAIKKVPFSHQGFEQRSDKMMKLGNLYSFGENLAFSHNYNDPVKVSIDGWMKSPGHKKNILGDYEETGVGIAMGKDGKFYSTQLFAKRQKK